ncbi:MAG: hypothetical protein COS99_05845 [Candidatus Omnitrophica bacterium CG07_land_8_20_14_0_80_42_15]|uniref:TolC family protein n=1 Tax=Candidatus Aquitaenariimonas noxiae TaxID=1974741 RepID=A0A2J0KZZ7_9BACT|nr:MAG: hypothetical protein COS99_05845 [Candidatus Omnitrophica bacterium CG07_land_8_20_14_0_80_42_15]
MSVMKKRTISVFLYTILLSVIIFHQTAIHAEQDSAISIEKIVEETLKSNPELLAARRSYEAANARIPQAASLNDPVLEFEYDKITADRMLSGNPMKTFSISQEIPFPTKLYLRAKIAAKLAKMSYENYNTKEKDIISQAKSAYAELFLIYKTIDINKESKSILDQFAASATNRYSTGMGAEGDVLKAQVEVAKTDNELITLEQKRLTAQAKLDVLMNKDPENEIGIPAAEAPVASILPLKEFYVIAKENNPELKTYRYAIDRGQAAYDLSINEFAPDFMVKFRQMADDGDFKSGSWAGMLGVTVPLWFFEKQAFGVKEMKSELEMLKAEYDAKEKNILLDIRDAYARIEANKKMIELYETAFIPQADEALKASIKGYESGKTDLFIFLDSQRTLIEFKLDHYKVILELRLALADLEKAIGVSLNEVLNRGGYGKK